MGEWREQRSFSFFSFLPLSMRKNTNMEEPKSKAKRGAKTAAAAQENKITLLPLSELHDFPNHPFKVRDDEAMQETTESIRQYGVLVPAIVRPREGGGYEIIAGHRRRHGSELAGRLPKQSTALNTQSTMVTAGGLRLGRTACLLPRRCMAHPTTLRMA